MSFPSAAPCRNRYPSVPRERQREPQGCQDDRAPCGGGGRERENWAWVDRDNWRCQGTLLCIEIRTGLFEGEKKIPFEMELNKTTKCAVTDLYQGLPNLEWFPGCPECGESGIHVLGF